MTCGSQRTNKFKSSRRFEKASIDLFGGPVFKAVEKENSTFCPSDICDDIGGRLFSALGRKAGICYSRENGSDAVEKGPEKAAIARVRTLIFLRLKMRKSNLLLNVCRGMMLK